MVEYGGMPGDPVLNLSSSTNLFSVPSIDTTPFNGNDCDEVELIAISDYDNGDVYWYESAEGGEPIFGFGDPWILVIFKVYCGEYVHLCREIFVSRNMMVGS